MSSFSLSSSTSVLAGGTNSTSYSTATRLYSISGNSWTTSTATILYGRYSATPLTLTWDTGILCGGRNSMASYSTNEKFSNALSSWVLRSSLPSTRWGSGGVSSNSGFGFVTAGGVTTSDNTNSTLKYNDSANQFTNRQIVPQAILRHGALSFTTNCSLAAGGRNSTGIIRTSYVLKDFSVETDITDGKLFVTNSTEITPVNHKATSSTLATIRLTNQTIDINKLVVSTLFKKYPTASNITYDVSLDDGSTWISAAAIDTIVDTSSLSGSGSNYNMVLRFNIYPYASADVWTSRSSMQAKQGIAAFGLTNNLGIEVGGGNSTLALTTSEIYNESSNNWTSDGALPDARVFIYGFGLKTGTGIAAGGYNSSSGVVSSAYFYNNSSSTWSLLTQALGTARIDPVGFKLTDYCGIITGGNNGNYLNTSEKLNLSNSSWIYVSSMPVAKDGPAGISLTSDTAVTAGGNNGSWPGTPGFTEKFSDSGNSWISKTSMNIGRDDLAEISLTSNFGLTSCGSNSTSALVVTELYSDAGNIWTFRKNFNQDSKWACGGISLTSNSGIVCGGSNGTSTYTGTSSRYDFGETSFVGFAALPLA